MRTSTLDNGIRVVTEGKGSLRSGSTRVRVGGRVGVGCRGVGGASHFLEHLLFKGTAARSAQDIAESVDAVGGGMNAVTAKEYTAY